MSKTRLGEFSDHEFRKRLAKEIQSATFPSEIGPTSHPRAVLLGGQSGAGKTALHKIYRQQFANNVIIINGDEFRSSHPNFAKLQQAFGDRSVNYTAPWAGRMTEALVDHLSRFGYNLIIEGTLRTAEVPMRSATLLRERGYDVSLALMAVKPEISLVSCQIRYEEMRILGTTPRATDPAHHNKIIDQIVANLTVLEESELFDGIALYNRAQEQLFPREGYNGLASEALRDILFGPWTEEERRHYRKLTSKLDYLKAK